MPISVKGSGGGGVTLDAGAAASATTLTLPNTNGTVVNTAPGTAGNVLTSNGTVWTSAAPSISVATTVGQVPFSTDGSTFTATQKIVQGTSVASTSGTSIDFTSIPSWVKRITVMFNGVSLSGTSNFLIQIGAGSVSTSGYTSSSTTPALSSSATSTAGFILTSSMAAAAIFSGIIVIDSFGSNIWVESSVIGGGSIGSYGSISGGNISLGGTLDRVRITTVNGTDTFDAGSINILYE